MPAIVLKKVVASVKPCSPIITNDLSFGAKGPFGDVMLSDSDLLLIFHGQNFTRTINNGKEYLAERYLTPTYNFNARARLLPRRTALPAKLSTVRCI